MTEPGARPTRAADVRIDRATPADLTVLAADRPGAPHQQIGVVLLLDTARFDVEHARRVLLERIPTVPRLRQRLVRLPPGLGRPIWVDDPGFDPDQHVRVRHPVRPVGAPEELFDLAADLVSAPLPRSRPLWSATLLAGPTNGPGAVVLVLHHVIADGIGGLAVLDRLLDSVDGTAHPADAGFPRPRPRRRDLVADAAANALRALAQLPLARRELRTMAAAGSGVHATPADPCSLLRPTGRHRRLAVARADLGALRSAAHRHGGTINDVLLAAVAGALRTVLAGRGEHLPVMRIAVVVGAARERSADRPGNATGPLVVGVPTDGSLGERVQRIAGVVRAARTGAMRQPSLVALQPLMRTVAALGLYRLFMSRQRRMHTLVSNLHGPDRPRGLGGTPVRELIPLSVGEAGNLTVQFVALSYAGQLTVTAVADPRWVPDLDALARALQAELDTATG